jgi:menaquinone-dependent protoporphyrinogen oxidase
VVVGSGVRAGRVYRETIAFLEQHAAELPELPLAFFVVCMTMHEDTPENRREAGAYLEQMKAAVPMAQPAATELFGGLLDMAQLSWPLRVVMKLRKETPGDYRDWEAIRSWAASLPAALSI